MSSHFKMVLKSLMSSILRTIIKSSCNIQLTSQWSDAILKEQIKMSILYLKHVLWQELLMNKKEETLEELKTTCSLTLKRKQNKQWPFSEQLKRMTLNTKQSLINLKFRFKKLLLLLMLILVKQLKLWAIKRKFSNSINYKPKEISAMISMDQWIQLL